MIHKLGIKNKFMSFSGETETIVTNHLTRKSNKVNAETIHLEHHQPGNIRLRIEQQGNYLFVSNIDTNTASLHNTASLYYRLNNDNTIRHIQRGRSVAMMPSDKITIYLPYIALDNSSQNDLMEITFKPEKGFNLRIITPAINE